MMPSASAVPKAVNIKQARWPEPFENQAADIGIVAVGIAEAEMRHVRDVVQELHAERLIEAELVAQLVHVFGRRRAALAGEHGCRVARREMD